MFCGVNIRQAILQVYAIYGTLQQKTYRTPHLTAVSELRRQYMSLKSRANIHLNFSLKRKHGCAERIAYKYIKPPVYLTKSTSRPSDEGNIQHLHAYTHKRNVLFIL